MPTDMCTRRLQREYMALSKKPVDHLQAHPDPNNILDWYFVVSPPDEPFKGGHFLGKLKFPPDYPMKPPAVIMLTPNGRFHTNRRLCLSMSDFHPETWNPLWSVSTILTGLFSFMLENTPTLGSCESTDAAKRR